MKLDKWQKEILDYDGNILLAKGRRIGATYIMAQKAVEYLVKNKNKHPSSQIICVSLTEDQAELIIAFATNYAKKQYPKLIGKKNNKPTLRRLIIVVNGNRRILLARPVGATGDAVRGFEGQILMVDEAPKMPKLFWASAKPVLATTGGKIWMWGTFFGKDKYFYKNYSICKNGKGRYKVWEKTTPEVFEEREFSEDWTEHQKKEAFLFLKEEEKDMTALEYAQEYLAIASENLRQFFPDEVIRKCMTQKRRKIILKNKDYYLGVDVARMGDDESTFEIIDRTNRDHLLQVENLTTKKTLTTDTSKTCKALDKKYDFRQIFIDDGGMGVGVFDQLLDDPNTRRKTIAILSSDKPLDADEQKKRRTLKNDIFQNLLVLMELGKISLLDDEEIFLSLQSVQCEYKEGKKIDFFGSNMHICDGLVRACWCAKDKSLNMFVY